MTTIKKEHHLFCGRQWTLSVKPAAGRAPSDIVGFIVFIAIVFYAFIEAFGLIGFALSKFYQMSVGFQIGMILIWIFFAIAYWYGKRKTKQRFVQFQEAITYMEQLLFTFQEKKKIE